MSLVRTAKRQGSRRRGVARQSQGVVVASARRLPMQPTARNGEQYQIGGLDAWSDDRENIARAFVPVVQYHELAERHRCFLCGRRGAGKSAIAIMSEAMRGWSWHKVIQGEHAEYGAYIDM